MRFVSLEAWGSSRCGSPFKGDNSVGFVKDC